jgi:hypothetical protein
MDEKEKILNELDQMAPALKGIDKQMAYSVPDGYFDLFPLSLMGKLAGQQKPSVPEGYFESFPATMLSKIRAMESNSESNEVEEISPLLAGISRKMPYSVPRGYFENFSIHPVTYEAPVIPIGLKRNRFQWAVAASVVIITGLFAWFYLFNNNTGKTSQPIVKQNSTEVTDTAIAAALAGIEDTSLHLELNGDDIANNTLSSLYYLSTENIETALQDFSEAEIKSQLDERVVLKNKS